MEIRHAIGPNEAKYFDTDSLRKEFLIKQVFKPGAINIIYSHIDRIIIGGVNPLGKPINLAAGKEIGADSFLERREIGIINVGGPGKVTIPGNEFELNNKDALYIGMGIKEVTFESKQKDKPAKFYFNCAPAHHSYPVKKISCKDAGKVSLGSKQESNKRTIYQLIHPQVLQTCQLLMGITELEPENIWNTMPCHTHERRMEVYFYFDMSDDTLVFHLFGKPDETRHIIVRNEQAVISPSWSIHSGVGTSNYTFIWGMVGENQTFTDMDAVPMSVLR